MPVKIIEMEEGEAPSAISSISPKNPQPLEAGSVQTVTETITETPKPIRHFGSKEFATIPANATEKDIQTDADTFNRKTRQKHLFNEIHNSFKTYYPIENAVIAGRGMDISKFPNNKNQPVLIIGSGPSLDKVLPTLKEWEGDIITSTSQATTCVYYGKEPTYILALDPDSHPEEIKIDTWEGRSSTLVFHPGVTPELVSSWPIKMGFFRKLEPQTPFYGNAQKIGYSLIKRFFNTANQLMQIHITPMINTEIVMLGCVLNAQIFIAELLGYNPLYLVGADFGFPGEKSRHDAWRYDGKGWAKSEANYVNMESPLIIKADNGTPTEYMMLFYVKNFMSAWRLQKQQIISCSEGVLEGRLPHAEWKDVLAQQGKMGGPVQGWPRPKAILSAEGYMASHNTFVIYFQKGIQFTEFSNGVKDIPQYFENMRNFGVKDCDWNATAKALKRVAKAGYLSDEDAKVVLDWKYEEVEPQEDTGPKEMPLRKPDLIARPKDEPGLIGGEKSMPTDVGVHEIAPVERKWGKREADKVFGPGYFKGEGKEIESE